MFVYKDWENYVMQVSHDPQCSKKKYMSHCRDGEMNTMGRGLGSGHQLKWMCATYICMYTKD